MNPDLSLVMNAHNEAGYILRTLRSTEEAARFAIAHGDRIELTVVLDRPSDELLDVINRYRPTIFDGYQTLTVDHGSLGLSRNAGINASGGEYVALCDADDLISFNAFDSSLMTARREGPSAVVTPEYLFGFGRNHDICRYADSEVVTPLRFLTLHPFNSRILARRELLLTVPFTDVPLGSGHAYEDWLLNCDLLASGARLVVAPGTILFHRRRLQSLSATATTISSRQIPPSRLFAPEVYLSATAAAMSRVAHSVTGSDEPAIPLADSSFLNTALCRELLYAANHIDPAISPGRYASSHWQATREFPVQAGVEYYRLCEAIGSADTITDIVFASPEMPVMRAERIRDALLTTASERAATRLLVLAESSGALAFWSAHQSDLPHDSVLLDVGDTGGILTQDDAEVLCLKLIQATAPSTRVHLGDSSFGRRFWLRFGALLADKCCVLHRMGHLTEEIDGRRFVVDEDFELISDARHTLSKIIAHHGHDIAADQALVGVEDDLWQLAPPPLGHGPQATSAAVPSAALLRYLEEFAADAPTG
ncbi:unannotated protein [freshwater metagenome]|uniref:Unannotated protein n=1 Tax=freshwater metagenome TaxID=449393 RepID=A0A6J7FHG3_9ZZZZ|nr:glycosyltransferase [Actinomycetota bacterium]